MRSHIAHSVVVVAFTILFSLVSVTTAQAQPTCSNASLQGSYGLHATGVTGAGGNFAAIGRFTFDGKGSLTATLFVRVAGNDLQLNITGTYSVNPDCIVDDTWNFNGALSTHKSVIVDRGRGYFILNNTSGDGSAISGEARKQFSKNEDDD
jgi:hypothetical protein